MANEISSLMNTSMVISANSLMIGAMGLIVGGSLCIGFLFSKLKSIEELEAKLHTTLKLRGRIEKLEKLMRPEGSSESDWQEVHRVKNWTDFFERVEEKYEDYDSLIQCLKSVENDSKKLARQVRKLHSVLNSRIHSYVSFRKIDTTTFYEEDLQRIANCLDNVDI